jgi:hypothetical protein
MRKTIERQQNGASIKAAGRVLFRVVCNPFRVGARVWEVPVAGVGLATDYSLPALRAESQ